MCIQFKDTLCLLLKNQIISFISHFHYKHWGLQSHERDKYTIGFGLIVEFVAKKVLNNIGHFL